MKKIIMFLIVIFLIIIGYVLLFNKKISYNLEYKINDYNIVESYELDGSNYKFIVGDGDYDFTFVINHNYSTKRKIVTKVNVQEEDEYKCATIKVFNDYLPYICYDGNEYVDSYIVGINKIKEDKKINTVNDIDVYNNDFDYYIWNGYGLTNVLTSKKYNFLTNEHYENDLSFRLDNYIIFADYDESREFNKFYIFNYDKKKIEEFSFDYKISTDSYFNGSVGDDIYLFDRKNKCQYKINIKKQKIEITSTSDYAISYDSKLDQEPLSNFIYSSVLFKEAKLVNFYTDNDKLYYKYNGGDESILISNNSIKSIIYYNDYKVFYLVDNSLYLYDLYSGEQKLLTNFEWNFSYDNKIFVF
jgi:hypothetical protein